MVPPMGYFKDKNTGEVVVVDETASIVKQIFDWYVDGYGLKAIAKKLNDSGIKSPSYYQKKLFNHNQNSNRLAMTFRYLWEQTGVKRILQNEFYAGTLVCHKVEHNKITNVRKQVSQENQFRHENFVPAIISKEVWEKAKFLLGDKTKRKVRAGSNKPMKRYTGLIKCADCGCVFVGKNRSWNGKAYTEYVCNGYHRYGKDYCTTHAISDMTLDKLIYEELKTVKHQAKKSIKTIESDINKWISQESGYKKKSEEIENKIKQIDLEIEKILMERIEDRENRAIYDGMLKKRREEKTNLQQNIKSIKNYDVIIKKRKTKMKKSVNLIDDIIKDGVISNTHLRMLIENIFIKDGKNGLQLEIVINADFRLHVDFYDEDGELIEKNFALMDSVG
jgi:site-specific DNA recombinase